MVAVSTLEAAPVVVSPKEGQDVTTVLLSDKLLAPFLLLNAIQLIVFLAKSLWSTEKKKLEEIQTAVSHIPMLIHKMEKLDEHVQRNVLTKDQTELLIWKQLRDKSQ